MAINCLKGLVTVAVHIPGTMIFCGNIRQILCIIKVNFVFCCDPSNYYIRKLSLVPS